MTARNSTSGSLPAVSRSQRTPLSRLIDRAVAGRVIGLGAAAAETGRGPGAPPSGKRSLIGSPSTVTSPHSVPTDGLTLSRSIWEMRLGDTPTRRAISRTVRPLRCRSSRRRAPRPLMSARRFVCSSGASTTTRAGRRQPVAQLLGEVLPVAVEAVRVAVGRPGRGRLEPEHGPALHLVEGVDAADAGPEDVAGPKRVALAVGDDVDLALEHVVRLLERMVVRVRDRAGLVADHEHRLQLRVEPLVHEHLHGDAAVGERGGRHARRDLGLVDPGALASAGRCPCRRAAAGTGCGCAGRGGSSGTGSVSGAGPIQNVSAGPSAPRGRATPPPPTPSAALGAPRVRDADGDRPAGAGLEPHGVPSRYSTGSPSKT